MEEEFVKWKTYILGAIVLNIKLCENISEENLISNIDKVVQDTYELIMHIADKMAKDGVESEGLNISITVSMQECQMLRI